MLTALHAGVFARLHQIARSFEGLLPIDVFDHHILLVFKLLVQLVLFRKNDGRNGKIIFAGEFEVALITARNSHNRAGSVIGHDIVGNPYGNLLAIDGIYHITTRERTVLFELSLGALDRSHLLGALHDLTYGGFVLGALNQLDQAVILGSKQEEGAAEQRIGACGENGNVMALHRIAFSIA